MVKLKEIEGEGETVARTMSVAGSVPLEAFTRLGEAQVAGAVSLLPLLLAPTTALESREFQYSLGRIVKGIASSRDSAREGYFSVLSILLKFRKDLSVTTLLEISNKELKIGSLSKSETGELCTGHVLLCGAVIRSGRFLDCSDVERTNLINTLLNASSKKAYLGLAAYTFISNFIEQHSEQDVREKLWPHIQETLTRPLNEYSMDQLYCLFTLHYRYPSVVKKFFKKSLKIPALFSDETLPILSEKLMSAPEFAFISHPIYEIFSKNLARSEFLVNFWKNEIETKIGVQNENRILISLTILEHVLKNIGENYEAIPNLLGDHLIPCILEWFKGFQSAKQSGKMLKFKGQKKYFVHENKGKQIITKSKEVFNVLQETLKPDSVSDNVKLEVLKKLLFNPGDIMFCDITNTRLVKVMIEDLKAEGVQNFASLLKNVISSESKKPHMSSDRPWTNMEKIRAAEMLTYLINHRTMMENVKWRIKNMQFFIQIGFFKSSENTELYISAELASYIKKCFYRCLTSKSSKLETLLKILSSLVDFIDNGIESNSETVSKNARMFSPVVLESWKTMKTFNKNLQLSEKRQNSKAIAVFHILSLHSGLFLFSDIMKPEMAQNSLEEVKSCYEHFIKDNKNKKTTRSAFKDGDIVDVEPDWTEVLTDVFLSFLSRDSYLLRTVVQCVFRLLCEYLTPSAVGQILSVLDPDNENNILTNKDENSDDDDNEDDNLDNSDEDENSEENIPNPSGESSSDENSDDDEDNITVNDQLRMAVQKALGSAAPETDTESIDADNITEEEGKQLDNALSSAFRMLRRSKGELTKKDKKNIRTVMEFRIRVLDLLQIYFEKIPSMDICLGMILPLFKCLEFSSKDSLQKPFEDKVRKCIKSLYSIKKFSSCEDVTLELLADYLKTIIDRKSRTQFVFQAIGDVITKCSTFIVRCSQKIDISITKKKQKHNPISEIYEESLEAFFTKRDCLLPVIFFHDVLHVRWDGNWNLLKKIIDKTFDENVRQFRKNEGLEMINVFYTSLKRGSQSDAIENPLLMQEVEVLFSNKISAYLSENNNANINERFFILLVKVLSTIKNYHNAFSKTSDNMTWTTICDSVQKIRALIKLKSNQEYFKFCNLFNMDKLKNCIQNTTSKESIDSGHDSNTDDEPEMKNNVQNGQSNGVKKPIIKKKNKNKERESVSKKESKMLRAQASCDGLQDVSFTSLLAKSNMNVDDIGEEISDDNDNVKKDKKRKMVDIEKPKKKSRNK